MIGRSLFCGGVYFGSSCELQKYCFSTLACGFCESRVVVCARSSSDSITFAQKSWRDGVATGIAIAK